MTPSLVLSVRVEKGVAIMHHLLTLATKQHMLVMMTTDTLPVGGVSLTCLMD